MKWSCHAESGETRVIFETSDREWALRTALSYLPGISVIAPLQLKQQVEQIISSTYRNINRRGKDEN